jgi:hypothetical protein
VQSLPTCLLSLALLTKQAYSERRRRPPQVRLSLLVLRFSRFARLLGRHRLPYETRISAPTRELDTGSVRMSSLSGEHPLSRSNFVSLSFSFLILLSRNRLSCRSAMPLPPYGYSSPSPRPSRSNTTNSSVYPPSLRPSSPSPQPSHSMYPAAALLDTHQHPSYSTDDFHLGVEGEDIALTSAPNGHFDRSSPQLALTPPGPPLARHSFLGRDPNASAGWYSAPGDGIMRPDSAQSEAEWKRRAGPLARGATRKVKLTRQGHFIAVRVSLSPQRLF